MRANKKIGLVLLTTAAVLLCSKPLKAQDAIKLDTFQCHIIGFDFGTIFPSSGASTVLLSDGGSSGNATMASLYKAPWLNFGINTFYKYKSNWLASIDADFWFGNDNLLHRSERMDNIYTSDEIIIGTNGTDAVVTAYNRGIALKAGVGKIFPPFPTRNPNSGILARLSAGWLQQQTIFTLNEVNAPQIDSDYALLYDHQRSGWMLTQSIGLWYMSNFANLINFYITFEVSECWTHSTRDYIYDNYLKLSGPDNNTYFDLLYTIKLCWMFPLKGKSAHEYYYF